MCVNGGSQLWWTWQVEDGFRKVKAGEKHAVKNLNHQLSSQLNDLVAEMRKNLNKLQRKKVNTLVIIDVVSTHQDVEQCLLRPCLFMCQNKALCIWRTCNSLSPF